MICRIFYMVMEQKVKQVVTNILTNACKYTDKGKVDFVVSCINQRNLCNLVISVKDTGRGIKRRKCR